MAHRLAAPLRRFSTEACTIVERLVDEVMKMESCPHKISRMLTIKDVYCAERKTYEVEQKALMRAYEAEQKAYEAQKKAYEEVQLSKVPVYLELLRARGLNNARGLFESLQEKVINLHPSTQGLKGSEKTWTKVLAVNPDLVKCLQKHLGTNRNLPAHLSTTYDTVSQHIHAGKDLSLGNGTIIFQPDYLSPEQCSTYVCLGAAVSVPCAPAPRRFIADEIKATSDVACALAAAAEDEKKPDAI